MTAGRSGAGTATIAASARKTPESVCAATPKASSSTKATVVPVRTSNREARASVSLESPPGMVSVRLLKPWAAMAPIAAAETVRASWK